MRCDLCYFFDVLGCDGFFELEGVVGFQIFSDANCAVGCQLVVCVDVYFQLVADGVVDVLEDLVCVLDFLEWDVVDRVEWHEGVDLVGGVVFCQQLRSDVVGFFWVLVEVFGWYIGVGAKFVVVVVVEQVVDWLVCCFVGDVLECYVDCVDGWCCVQVGVLKIVMGVVHVVLDMFVVLWVFVDHELFDEFFEYAYVGLNVFEMIGVEEFGDALVEVGDFFVCLELEEEKVFVVDLGFFFFYDHCFQVGDFHVRFFNIA